MAIRICLTWLCKQNDPVDFVYPAVFHFPLASKKNLIRKITATVILSVQLTKKKKLYKKKYRKYLVMNGE